MPIENSRSRKSDAEKHAKMLWSLESGIFDCIECPKCGKCEMSAWFTNPAPNEFRTWFVCCSCGYESHTMNAVKPANFRADRIHLEFQKRDEEIVKQRKFPPPQN